MAGGVSYWPASRSGSGGGGSGSAMAANIVSLASGVQAFSVTYSTTITSAGVPVFSFINTVDSPDAMIYLTGLITAFSTTGFSVELIAPPNSNNYQMSYIVTGVV